MVGVNRTGIDANSLQYELRGIAYCHNGCSLDLLQSSSCPVLSVVDVSITEVCATRSVFPSLLDRRGKLY